MTPLISLTMANLLFVGAHFAMSHPLRAAMVAKLGERGFLGVYSLISLALLAWIGHVFGKAPSGPLAWDGSSDAVWAVSSVLTLAALALLLGSLRGNPALPEMGADAAASAQADGAFAVTRHPMMWGFGLWSVAHILAWPSPRTLVTAGAIGFLALVGARLQDAKKERLVGKPWQAWEAKTTYWPNFANLPRIGWAVWLITLTLWLVITWVHVWWAGIPAGVWLWLA